MKKIAIYYRVSTARQEIDSQRQAVEGWLSGLKETDRPDSIREFKDEGISGKLSDRPAYTAMLKAAFNGEIDTIVVYRLDRLSRNANHAIKILIELDEVGVAFVSVSQPVLNLGPKNPFRRTMLAAFAEIAHIERECTVGRIKAGLEAAKRRGTRLGRPLKVDRAQKERVLNLRHSGLTYRAIAKKESLSLSTVARILS